MKRLKFFSVWLIALLLSNTTFGKASEDILAVNHLVLTYLATANEISQLKLKSGELYSDKMLSQSKDYYWHDSPPEIRAGFTLEFKEQINLFILTIADLHEGEIIQSRVEGDFACVFITNENLGMVFPFRNDGGWQYIIPALHFRSTGYNPQSCHFDGIELDERYKSIFRLDDELLEKWK